MATLHETRALIRFHLSQLSAQNGHHEFEHLCRDLARHRICSNILPATGPVSAGGDQGRDFETFRTYLGSSCPETKTFVGVPASSKPIAFACSITADPVSKIRSDVKTIVSGGTAVEAIYFFSTENITTAARHRLQSFARKLEVHLEILDGEALTELLAQRVLFWIAVQHLHIPSEMCADLTEKELPEWYHRCKATWTSGDPVASTYANFEDLRLCSRMTIGDGPARPDLEVWLAALQCFGTSAGVRHLRLRALYELCAIAMRTKRSLSGLEPNVSVFFDEALETRDVSIWDDAAVLLTYCAVAQPQGVLDVPFERIQTWYARLLAAVDDELGRETTDGTRCMLLFLRGQLALCPVPELDAHASVDEALESWTKLVDLVPRVPLFPLERFAGHINILCELVIDHDDLLALARESDRVLGARLGELAAGNQASERAHALFKQGEFSRALDELHILKARWFTNESLSQSIAAMRLVAACYSELGLYAAAKQYSLAAAYAAGLPTADGTQSMIPSLLMDAAEADYAAGSWAGFLDLIPSIGAASAEFADVDEPDESFTHAAFYASMVIAVSQRLLTDISDLVRQRIDDCGLGGLIDDLPDEAQAAWADCDDSELQERLRDEFAGPPFGDLGEDRAASWCQAGTRWTLTWRNRYEETLLAEEFMATLQILLHELGKEDLCLSVKNVDLSLVFGEKMDMKHEDLTDNSRCYEACLSRNPGEPNRRASLLIGSCMVLLSDVSFLPFSILRDALERASKRGVPIKVAAVRPYVELLSAFVPESQFDVALRESRGAFLFASPPGPCMPTDHSPEYGYDSERSKADIANRYRNLLLRLAPLIDRIKSTALFCGSVAELRGEGWRDWHILGGIHSAALTHAAVTAGIPLDGHNELLKDLLKPDALADVVDLPPELLATVSLRASIFTTMMSSLSTFGLECRQQAAHPEHVRSFLDERFHYLTDDIAHEDPFGISFEAHLSVDTSEPEGPQLVSTNSGKCFHCEDCPAMRGRSITRRFGAQAEALASGLRPCRLCEPETNRRKPTTVSPVHPARNITE